MPASVCTAPCEEHCITVTITSIYIRTRHSHNLIHLPRIAHETKLHADLDSSGLTDNLTRTVFATMKQPKTVAALVLSTVFNTFQSLSGRANK